tara:strand:- start:649 stop:1056 length:408 start_codon:yes stop_codon:yes gene_type:complete
VRIERFIYEPITVVVEGIAYLRGRAYSALTRRPSACSASGCANSTYADSGVRDVPTSLREAVNGAVTIIVPVVALFRLYPDVPARPPLSIRIAEHDTYSTVCWLPIDVHNALATKLRITLRANAPLIDFAITVVV